VRLDSIAPWPPILLAALCLFSISRFFSISSFTKEA